MKPTSILVVDDDPKMRRLMRRCFESEGFCVREADSEIDVLKTVAGNQADLVTLDISLGRESGLAIARNIRKDSEIPIIIVSAKEDVIDRVVGLEVGADDYITKPFHVRELVARVRSLLRRSAQSTHKTNSPAEALSDGVPYHFDDLVYDPGKLELRGRDGQVEELTTADIKLLQVFLDRPKRPLSRDQIMTLMNGASWNPLDRTIDNQVARLRKKLERAPSRPALIKTVRGVGYMLASDVVRR